MIDPAREEGPICIEVTSDRQIALPEGPHPLLGARLAQRPSPAGRAPSP